MPENKHTTPPELAFSAEPIVAWWDRDYRRGPVGKFDDPHGPGMVHLFGSMGVAIPKHPSMLERVWQILRKARPVR